MGRVQEIYVYIDCSRVARKKIKRRVFGRASVEHLLMVEKIRNRNASPAGTSYLGKVRSTLTSV